MRTTQACRNVTLPTPKHHTALHIITESAGLHAHVTLYLGKSLALPGLGPERAGVRGGEILRKIPV